MYSYYSLLYLLYYSWNSCSCSIYVPQLLFYSSGLLRQRNEEMESNMFFSNEQFEETSIVLKKKEISKLLLLCGENIHSSFGSFQNTSIGTRKK